VLHIIYLRSRITIISGADTRRSPLSKRCKHTKAWTHSKHCIW